MWWLTTTAALKTSISSLLVQRTHYPPNCYRLMGQVSIHRGMQIHIGCYLKGIAYLCFPVSVVFVFKVSIFSGSLMSQVEMRAV